MKFPACRFFISIFQQNSTTQFVMVILHAIMLLKAILPSTITIYHHLSTILPKENLSGGSICFELVRYVYIDDLTIPSIIRLGRLRLKTLHWLRATFRGLKVDCTAIFGVVASVICVVAVVGVVASGVVSGAALVDSSVVSRVPSSWKETFSSKPKV